MQRRRRAGGRTADGRRDIHAVQKHLLASILAAADPVFAAALDGADPATASPEAISAAIARSLAGRAHARPQVSRRAEHAPRATSAASYALHASEPTTPRGPAAQPHAAESLATAPAQPSADALPVAEGQRAPPAAAGERGGDPPTAAEAPVLASAKTARKAKATAAGERAHPRLPPEAAAGVGGQPRPRAPPATAAPAAAPAAPHAPRTAAAAVNAAAAWLSSTRRDWHRPRGRDAMMSPVAAFCALKALEAAIAAASVLQWYLTTALPLVRSRWYGTAAILLSTYLPTYLPVCTHAPPALDWSDVRHATATARRGAPATSVGARHCSGRLVHRTVHTAHSAP